MRQTDHRGALAELACLLTDAQSGHGRLALVTGGLASGKTQLLHRFYAQAADAGALLLTATGARAERALRAGVIDQIFHGAGLPPEVADRVARLITPFADDDSQDARTIRHASAGMVHEVCGVVLELSRERPVVLAIDDVQFADSVSLQLVLYLRRRMTSARVLVVLSEWEQPQPTLPLFHAEISKRPHHRVRLAPLSRAGIVDLLGGRVAAQSAAELAPVWHEISGGNPMLVEAMVDDLVNGVVAGPTVAGPAFGRAVQSCLHRWEPNLLDVARALAVLGDDRTSALVARLANTSPEDADRAAEILTAAGLLADGGFRHGAAAAAVLESLPVQERSRLHARAAELLYQRGAAACAVAAHLLAADRVAAAWSVPVLLAAAEQALTADDTAGAVRLLELALPAADADQRLGVTKTLVRALWRVNPSAAAAHIAPLREAMWAGALRGRDAVTLVRHALWNGDEATAVRALTLLGAGSDLLDAQGAAELRMICQWFHGFGPVTAAAESLAPAGDDPWAVTARALGSFWAGHSNAETVASAELILQSSWLGNTAPEVVATALLILVHGGAVERAARWCEQLSADAACVGVATWQAVVEVVSAEIDLLRGDAARAADRADAAMRLLLPQDWGIVIGYPLAILIEANTVLGRHAEVDDLMRLRVPEAMYGTVCGLRYLHARGHGLLAFDRVLAAISDFQHCGRRMRAWHIDLPVLVPWRTDLAAANLMLGRPDAAAEHIAEQLRLPGGNLRTRGVSLRMLAAASEPAQRPELLREAVACLREAGDRVALAGTLADLRAALGEDAEDGPLLDWPDPVAESAVADGVWALSDSERRVAELAATGHTNREIGRSLYITVSTVEQHLTRVYRKLGVKRRADLPRRLTRGAGDSRAVG